MLKGFPSKNTFFEVGFRKENMTAKKLERKNETQLGILLINDRIAFHKL